MQSGSSSPLVSVIIPLFNRENYVEECILSVLHQTYPHFELIIIDDGSTDGAARKVKNLIEKYPSHSILFLTQENAGICKTLNRGLKIAKGEYVSYLGCDDAYLENFLKDTVEAHSKAGPSICSVYMDGYVIDGEGKRLGRFTDRSPVPWGKNQHKELLVSDWLPAPGILHKKSILLEYGLFDESLPMEDYDMWLKMTKKYKFKGLPQPGFLYRIHEGNMSGSDANMANLITLLTHRHKDLQNYLNFVSSILEGEILAFFKLLSPLNVDLLIRTLLRRIQIILKGNNPTAVSIGRQKCVLQKVARNYGKKIWRAN